MASHFDITFENSKAEFQKKMGVDWINNKALFLSYLQSVHLSSLIETTHNGLGEISAMQKENQQLLQHISENVSK